MANITEYTDTYGVTMVFESDMLWAVDSGTGFHVHETAPATVLQYLQGKQSDGIPYYPWREILSADRWVDMLVDLADG